MFVPTAVAGWACFGLAGSIPPLLWWWQQRPPSQQAAVWQIDLREVRGARLGPWRVRISRHRRRPLEIFCDELSRADLARLRRSLKFQLAAG